MRLIDADALIGELHTQFFYDGRDRTRVYAKIQEQPTADVVEKSRYDILLEHANILAEEMRKYQNTDVPERNVGKWEKNWHSYFKQELPCCSVCGHFSAMRWKYCPNCGADMREETDHAQLD